MASLDKLELARFYLMAKNQGRDIHGNGLTPIELACKNKYPEIIAFLLQGSGLDVNPEDLFGENPLHYAISKRNLPLVKFLSEKLEVNVNQQDKEGRTALHLATQVSYNNPEVVEWLIQMGGDVNKKNISGETPVYCAAANGFLKIVELFVKSQADVSAKEFRHGMTALHIAASNNHMNVLKFLLELGVDINEKDNDGWTALTHNIQCKLTNNISKRPESVKFLLEEGAEMNNFFIAVWPKLAEPAQIADQIAKNSHFRESDLQNIPQNQKVTICKRLKILLQNSPHINSKSIETIINDFIVEDFLSYELSLLKCLDIISDITPLFLKAKTKDNYRESEWFTGGDFPLFCKAYPEYQELLLRLKNNEISEQELEQLLLGIKNRPGNLLSLLLDYNLEDLEIISYLEGLTEAIDFFRGSELFLQLPKELHNALELIDVAIKKSKSLAEGQHTNDQLDVRYEAEKILMEESMKAELQEATVPQSQQYPIRLAATSPNEIASGLNSLIEIFGGESPCGGGLPTHNGVSSNSLELLQGARLYEAASRSAAETGGRDSEDFRKAIESEFQALNDPLPDVLRSPQSPSSSLLEGMKLESFRMVGAQETWAEQFKDDVDLSGKGE